MPSKYDSKSGSPKKSRVQKYRGGGMLPADKRKMRSAAVLQGGGMGPPMPVPSRRSRPTPPPGAPGMRGGMGFGMKGGSSVPSYNQVIEKKGGGKINHNPSSVNP
jgi:hypothetical protein